jgi:hypothetical protein
MRTAVLRQLAACALSFSSLMVQAEGGGAVAESPAEPTRNNDSLDQLPEAGFRDPAVLKHRRRDDAPGSSGNAAAPPPETIRVAEHPSDANR